jgi:hypothetical protein
MSKTRLEDTLSHFYYGLRRPSAFSTIDKLQREATIVQGRAVTRPDVSAFMDVQDAYTMHRPVCKRFSRNAYIVYVLDLRQIDILDLQKFAKYNYRYALSVIDVFSKNLHLVPLKTKTGSAVAEAFALILRDLRYMNNFCAES